MKLRLQAVLLVCSLATAASMQMTQMKETETERAQFNELRALSAELNDRVQMQAEVGDEEPGDLLPELERRAKELELEIGRAVASRARAQAHDAERAHVAKEPVIDASDKEDTITAARKKDAEKIDLLKDEVAANKAIIEDQAKAKAVYNAKKAKKHSKKKHAKKHNMTKVATPATKTVSPIADTSAEDTSRRSHTSKTSAVGDPHLVNMMGQRFDIARTGDHVLIQVPRMAQSEATLLRVLGTVERSGGACADMYFTAINITGHWTRDSRADELHFSVRDFIVKDEMKWTHFGPLSLKVVHGHTHEGIEYLNFFVKNLGSVKYHVGGLMGEDDHTHAATPTADCRRVLSLLQVQTHEEDERHVSSVAVAEM